MSIRWVKQYRGRHSVDYAGNFTSGLNRITGTYFNGAGSFEMFCKEPTPDSCKPDPCKPDPCQPDPCTFPPSGEWTGFYVHCGVKYSQVPQPTCYWKWVGVSMPQKVGTFSLRPSSTAIWRCSRLGGGLLSSYRSQVALTPALEFYIHPVLLQPGIHVTLPILTSSPSQSSFRFHRFFYLYFPFPPS